jgi:3-hydroxyisobutyrate dehydrogenase-like beta-hydroxyacid dehydrogenase
MKVGFVGLGSLGEGMARRLAQTGFDLVACDIHAPTLAAFDEPGAVREADPMATARQVEALCACVRMDADLEALAAGGALFDALGEGGLFIIHSTVAPELAQALAAAGKARGVQVLDAGVSGGAHAALRGELSIYVGGEAAAFERARPILEAYGKSILHLGPVGRGMQGKLLNNLVSIANYGLAAAILDLGETLGFDREPLRQALMAGSADSYALRAIPGILRPEGALALRELLGKDLDHARGLAAAGDVSLAALVPAAESMLARLTRAADAA